MIYELSINGRIVASSTDRVWITTDALRWHLRHRLDVALLFTSHDEGDTWVSMPELLH